MANDLRELSCFSGIGLGLLGSKLRGWRTVCGIEINEYCRRVLMQRQDDGCLDPFPIWDDIRTFDGRPWRGLVDIVSGGFPCQDISVAGSGEGIDGERSGLWSEMARVIREVQPEWALVENSPMLASRGLGRVLGDLAELGMDARWGVFAAAHAGAAHRRYRIFIVAHANCSGLPWPHRNQEASEWVQSCLAERVQDRAAAIRAMLPEGFILRRGDGGPDWVERIRALGNGQVPRVVPLACRLLGGPVTDG